MDFIRVNIDRWLYAICAVLSLPRQALADQHLRCGSVSAFLSVLDINSDFVRRFKRLSTTDTSVPGKRAIKICRTWGMPLSPPSQNWSKTTILVQIHREKWPYTPVPVAVDWKREVVLRRSDTTILTCDEPGGDRRGLALMHSLDTTGLAHST